MESKLVELRELLLSKAELLIADIELDTPDRIRLIATTRLMEIGDAIDLIQKLLDGEVGE